MKNFYKNMKAYVEYDLYEALCRVDKTSGHMKPGYQKFCVNFQITPHTPVMTKILAGV